MAAIRQLRLQLQTGVADGAGTDGDVFVGIGGREFYVDSSAENFEADTSQEFIFGDHANVLHGEYNDPRHPQLFTEAAFEQPVYLRFAPKGRDDNWLLRRAQVYINDQLFPVWDSDEILAISPIGLWMGVRRGLYLEIPKHRDAGLVQQVRNVNVAVQLS